MSNLFSVMGFNPGSGHVVELILMAGSAQEAKQKAEESGLRHVVVSVYTDKPPDDPSQPPGSPPRRSQPPTDPRGSDPPPRPRAFSLLRSRLLLFG